MATERKVSAVSSSEADSRARLGELRNHLERLLSGKQEFIDSLLCALLSKGHLLFEDVPGVGKTTVIKALSKLLGMDMARVQCTSDLLPSDILGVEVFDPENQAFVFHKGPVFSPLLFVDELNRCSPRTQSALLEAMAEGVVTINRTTYALPEPFLVFATQNPVEFIGTYPLPESQLDRFSGKLSLNYPSRERETEILRSAAEDALAGVPDLKLGADWLVQRQVETMQVHVSERVASYVTRVLEATRNHKGIHLGVSTRGGVIWVRMAQAHAYLQGRDFVTPDDLHAMATTCLAHRIVVREGASALAALQEVLAETPVEHVP